jgi:iron only hydrogenase large subunit-like protein/uncharacterized Fe-S cluster-containing protein
MADGQATVEPSRCIACGACIRECPQGAKTYRRDIDTAQALIESGAAVAVSLAPSFAAAFGGWQRGRLVSALRKLGFSHVAETAIGAWYTARRTCECMRSGPDARICTACPAVVNYIEKYSPGTAGRLVPIVSPMVAHARHIKAKLGPQTKVVFIGPCVAKKSEMDRPDIAGSVDAVLTFDELSEWLNRAGIELSSCEESDFDDFPCGDSRLFPLSGGLLKTAELDTELTSAVNTVACGPESVKEAVAAMSDGLDMRLEPLFCREGCINGPGFKSDKSLPQRRADILDYNAQPKPKSCADGAAPDLSAAYAPNADYKPSSFSEEEIEAVLERTGKRDPDQRLNCGACGYPSCRAKAIAVLEGMAVPEMCIPLMRRLAEQRSDLIISTSPNGMIMLNSELEILSMNPAFKKMFCCTDELIGRRISYLIDSEPFEAVSSGTQERVNAVIRHSKYSLVCRQIVYALPEEKQIVGIFVNLTEAADSTERIEKLRNQTITQAQELLDHQLSMAQQIARYLGESTARGEELVQKLIKLSEADDKDGKNL